MKSKIQFDLGFNNEPIVTIKTVYGTDDLRDKVSNRFCSTIRKTHLIAAVHESGGSDGSGENYEHYRLDPVSIEEVLKETKIIRELSDEQLYVLYNTVNSEYAARRYEADRILDESALNKFEKDVKKAEKRLRDKYSGQGKANSNGSFTITTPNPILCMNLSASTTSGTLRGTPDNITLTGSGTHMPHSTGNVI